jgi:hypothetical protein
LIQYQQQINFPNPWPGGTWRLRDIMDYELIVSDAALETMSKYRRELLRGVASMAEEAMATAEPSRYWTISINDQRDPITATRLAALMLEHGVEVRLSGDKKSFFIPTWQPYGRFVEEMMGLQRYPEVRPAPNSGILEPYDVAAWSLPLMTGVDAKKTYLTPEERKASTVLKEVPWPEGGAVEGNHKYFTVGDQGNNVFMLINEMQKLGAKVYSTPSGTVIPLHGAADHEFIITPHPQLASVAKRLHLEIGAVDGLMKTEIPVHLPRIALYKSYIPSMDEGWTRFVLEQYGFDVKNIENKQVRAGNLNAAFDVVVLPDSSREVIVDGRQGREGYQEELPPEYTGGIGKEGVKALKDFVDKGGTLITLARASEVVMGEEFNLPVRNAVSGTAGRGTPSAADFNIPGSLLRVYVDTDNPVGYGMPKEIAAFVDAPLAFQTSAPAPDTQRSVIAWYPDDAKDILLSGYAHGAEKLERKAAVVSFTRGKGKVVLFGFRVQHRAQTEGTFQMLFNAIEWAGME